MTILRKYIDKQRENCKKNEKVERMNRWRVECKQKERADGKLSDSRREGQERGVKKRQKYSQIIKKGKSRSGEKSDKDINIVRKRKK